MIKIFLCAMLGIALVGCKTGVENVNLNTPYIDIILKESKRQGVDPNIVVALIEVESNFNRHATGRAGEIGLMQIKLPTARGIGYTGTRAELYNAETNIRYGVKYLREAYNRSKNDCEALKRYNQGIYAVRFNGHAKNYCNRVLSLV